MNAQKKELLYNPAGALVSRKMLIKNRIQDEEFQLWQNEWERDISIRKNKGLKKEKAEMEPWRHLVEILP